MPACSWHRWLPDFRKSRQCISADGKNISSQNRLQTFQLSFRFRLLRFFGIIFISIRFPYRLLLAIFSLEYAVISHRIIGNIFSDPCHCHLKILLSSLKFHDHLFMSAIGFIGRKQSLFAFLRQRDFRQSTIHLTCMFFSFEASSSSASLWHEQIFPPTNPREISYKETLFAWFFINFLYFPGSGQCIPAYLRNGHRNSLKRKRTNKKSPAKRSDPQTGFRALSCRKSKKGILSLFSSTGKV